MTHKAIIYSVIISIAVWVYPPADGVSQPQKDTIQSIPIGKIDTTAVKWDSAYNDRKQIMHKFNSKQISTLSNQANVFKEVARLKLEVLDLKKRLAQYPKYIVKTYTFTVPRTKKTGWFNLKSENYVETITQIDTIKLKDYMLNPIITVNSKKLKKK